MAIDCSFSKVGPFSTGCLLGFCTVNSIRMQLGTQSTGAASTSGCHCNHDSNYTVAGTSCFFPPLPPKSVLKVVTLFTPILVMPLYAVQLHLNNLRCLLWLEDCQNLQLFFSSYCKAFSCRFKLSSCSLLPHYVLLPCPPQRIILFTLCFHFLNFCIMFTLCIWNDI